jgi:hypothetical protein
VGEKTLSESGQQHIKNELVLLSRQDSRVRPTKLSRTGLRVWVEVPVLVLID